MFAGTSQQVGMRAKRRGEERDSLYGKTDSKPIHAQNLQICRLFYRNSRMFKKT